MSYNWKRFWCPREGSFSLSDGGYLYKPDSDKYNIYNPEVVPFDSIAEIPCLILLGEPGIGKTSAMKAEREAIDKKVESEGDKTLWLNLSSYSSEDRLIHNLFENKTFVSWEKGEYRLHIFLDSLDECLLRIDNLASLLIDELEKYPVERLYLRIACRTAYWKNKLEDRFKKIWGKNEVNVYELVPLRRIDVIEAAEDNDLDATVFLSEIDRKNAVPFAIKPITLKFLINSYSKNGQLPDDQTELYSEGCRCLCEEINEDRPENARKLAPEQRLIIASRIAAITIFSKRYAIWTGTDLGDVPEEDVKIQRLSGGNESFDNNRFDVTVEAIRETLDTGLFSSRGPNRIGWAHQTYAEYLAARYLVQHDMPLAQITSLITHPGDPEGKLIPQLHGTAAWLSTMSDDVFRHIMRVDPYVLLRSDLRNVDNKYKETIIDMLLKLYDGDCLPYPDWQDIGLYDKLSHPRNMLNKVLRFARMVDGQIIINTKT